MIKNILEIGMYCYVKDYYENIGIGKILNIHPNGFYESQVIIQFKNSVHSVSYSKVVGSYNKTDILNQYNKFYNKAVQ